MTHERLLMQAESVLSLEDVAWSVDLGCGGRGTQNTQIAMGSRQCNTEILTRYKVLLLVTGKETIPHFPYKEH